MIMKTFGTVLNSSDEYNFYSKPRPAALTVRLALFLPRAFMSVLFLLHPRADAGGAKEDSRG